MYISKSMVVVVAILSAIIGISSVIAQFKEYYVIPSSGSISYGSPSARPSVYSSEIRAVFFKMQSMAVAPDWGLVCDTLVDYGINTLILDEMTLIYVHHPSIYVPYSAIDDLGNAITAAHARGIKVYVSFCTLFGAYQQEHYLLNSVGVSVAWTCPTKASSRTHIRNLVEEVVTNYDIDGLCIDYGRFDGTDVCYCPECKARFESWLGETIPDNNWAPTAGGGGDFSPTGSRYNEFMEGRCQSINDLVRDISSWVKAIRSDVKICAFIWGSYSLFSPEGYIYYLGQDWFSWVKEGYVDWVAGMAYTQLLDIIANCVTNALQYGTGGPQGKVPYVSFLAKDHPTPGAASVDNFKAQIDASRAAGADGWIIYCYGGPGEFVGFAADIRPYLDAIDLYPTFSIENITASTTPNSCTITWTTGLPATSKVEYSTSPLFTASSIPSSNFPGFSYWDVDHVPGTIVEDVTPKTNHSITLTDLQGGTLYYFRVQSQDPNDIATSKVYTFEL